MNVNDLPSEILTRILNECHPQDWLGCECVCKSWWKILREFWKRVIEVECEAYGQIRVTFQDGRSYRLTCYGELDNDDWLLIFLLKRCGDQLQKLILHIPQEPALRLNSDTLQVVGHLCKNLKSLSLNGCVSPIADSIGFFTHHLSELEELFIWDESFPDDSPSDVNSAILIGDILSACTKLRIITLNFFFISPPSDDACGRLSNLQHIETIRWLFWSPLPPVYVETFLSCLLGCGGTLRELNFCCKLKSPLNDAACARYVRQLSEVCPNLEVIDLGFQLNVEMHEEYSDDTYYDPVERAPWTYEVLSALNSFQHVRDLSLRYFELSDGNVVSSLKDLCANLRVLRIEDNYGVTGKLTWELAKNLPNLEAFSISQAQLSHADLVELIVRCPKLENVRFSNLEAMSFKRLVLDAHAALHHCGCRGDDGARVLKLNLKLDTARSYIHDEAEELKNVQLCGLSLLPPGHANVVIDRVCRKSDARDG